MKILHYFLIGVAYVFLICSAIPADNVETIFREDFEDVSPPAVPSGWLVLDANSDGAEWITRDKGGDRGGNCARFLSDAANPGNDWLFTSAVFLDAGTAYELSFISRNTSPGLPHNLEVWAGTAQNPASMTDSVLPVTVFVNQDLQETTAPLSVASSGTYYFGFKSSSDPNTLAFHLDTIQVSEPESDLQIIFQMDKIFYEETNVFTPTEDKECLMWVTNSGSSAIKVNSLTCFGYEDNPDFQLSLRISDPDGQEMETTVKHEPAIPEESDFIMLDPGEMFYKYYDLSSDIYDFSKAGDYTIRAVYKNVFQCNDGDAWMGKIASDPVTITVNP